MNLEKIKEMCKANPKGAVVIGIVLILVVVAVFQ